MRMLSVSAMALIASISISSAQGTPFTKTIPVTFTGVVANDVTNEIRIRQPDGSYAKFNGPVPDYPYKKGDAVTLSFNAVVPTQAYYKDGGPYTGQVASDGIYRIGLSSPSSTTSGAGGNIGDATDVDVSGPIGTANYFGEPGNGSMTLVYDSNADSYSIDFGANGGLTSGAWQGPGYIYNSDTGEFTPCYGSGCAPVPENNNLFAINGSNPGELRSTPIGIYGSGNGAITGNAAGFFDLIFSGSWNLPSFSSPVATQVPEPSMMVLFGGGVAALVARRRRKAT